MLKTLAPKDIGKAGEQTPAQIAEDTHPLADYSSGQIVESHNADDLARLSKDSDEDSAYSAPAS